ncbi:MAG TPA: AraC family ligand binding domain-containing protein [Ktedonobacteraceae bacterium]
MVENNIDLCETHIIGEQTREYIVGEQARSALERYHIMLAGISYAQVPFAFVRHRPAISQILVSLEGWGEVFLDGEWFSCGPGQVYLTPAAVSHAYRARSNEDWKICWVIYHSEQNVFPIIPLERPTLLSLNTPELVLAIEGIYHESLSQAEWTVLSQWAYLIDAYVHENPFVFSTAFKRYTGVAPLLYRKQYDYVARNVKA